MLRRSPMPSRSAPMKRTPIRKQGRSRSAKTRSEGSLGIVRLYGREMAELRWKAFERSGGVCEMLRNGERCGEHVAWNNMEPAHIRNRRMYGDTPENVLVSCKWRRDGRPGCHALSHNAGGKPCPAKPR